MENCTCIIFGIISSIWMLWLLLLINDMFNKNLTIFTFFIATKLIFMQDFINMTFLIIFILLIDKNSLICASNFQYQVIIVIRLFLRDYTNHVQLVHLHHIFTSDVFKRWRCYRWWLVFNIAQFYSSSWFWLMVIMIDLI